MKIQYFFYLLFIHTIIFCSQKKIENILVNQSNQSILKIKSRFSRNDLNHPESLMFIESRTEQTAELTTHKIEKGHAVKWKQEEDLCQITYIKNSEFIYPRENKKAQTSNFIMRYFCFCLCNRQRIDQIAPSED